MRKAAVKLLNQQMNWTKALNLAMPGVQRLVKPLSQVLVMSSITGLGGHLDQVDSDCDCLLIVCCD